MFELFCQIFRCQFRLQQQISQTTISGLIFSPHIQRCVHRYSVCFLRELFDAYESLNLKPLFNIYLSQWTWLWIVSKPFLFTGKYIGKQWKKTPEINHKPAFYEILLFVRWFLRLIQCAWFAFISTPQILKKCSMNSTKSLKRPRFFPSTPSSPDYFRSEQCHSVHRRNFIRNCMAAPMISSSFSLESLHFAWARVIITKHAFSNLFFRIVNKHRFVFISVFFTSHTHRRTWHIQVPQLQLLRLSTKPWSSVQMFGAVYQLFGRTKIRFQ